MISDTQKMFQAIIHGQNALKQDLATRIDKVDQKVGKLGEELKKVEKRLTRRIDNLGQQLAYLEDDTPTIEDFDKLEKRVEILKRKIIPL